MNVEEESAELEGLANALHVTRLRLKAVHRLDEQQTASIRAHAKRDGKRKQEKAARKKNRRKG